MDRAFISFDTVAGLLIGTLLAIGIGLVFYPVVNGLFGQEEEEGLPDLVEERFRNLVRKINGLEDGEKDFYDLELARNGVYLFLDKGDKDIKIQRVRETGVVARSFVYDVRLLDKPGACGRGACICVCNDLLLVYENRQETESRVDISHKFQCKGPIKCEEVEGDKFSSEGFYGDKFGRRLSTLDKPKLRSLSRTPYEFGQNSFVEGGVVFDLQTLMGSLQDGVVKDNRDAGVLRIYLERKGDIIGACLKEPCI